MEPRPPPARIDLAAGTAGRLADGGLTDPERSVRGRHVARTIPARAGSHSVPMHEILNIAAFITVWYVLQRFVLPRLGVRG